ncbi:hypothetical protein EDC01DRAFT_691703 [Geopyxis carbonaria]|nr:hypothetical protein EDC01DRAFT_691703 [Geopyxis carbonaria]
MKDMLNLLSLATALTALVVPGVMGCGVLIHNQIVHRASHLFSLPPTLGAAPSPFSALLTAATNAPSLQAGAFFPDWGYQCFSHDGDAEAAHWPPFLVAAVEHVHETYGNISAITGDEQAHVEGLLAFIFAAASHQSADATWHAIRLPTGLLAAVAAVDFGGDVARAHKTLDVGADFLAAARLARLPEGGADWVQAGWTVPVEDLMQIYKRMGRTPSRFVVRYCMTRGLAALKSELAIGGALLDGFAEASPMLLDEVDGYYLGGMDEMTARTVGCWNNLTRWFTHGVDEAEKARGGWGICDVFQAIAAKGGAGVQAGIGGHSVLDEPRLLQRTLREMENIHVATDAFGAETYTFKNAKMDAVEEDRVKDDTPHGVWLPHNDGWDGFAPPTYVTTYTPYAHLGASLAFLDWPFAHSPSTRSLALAVGAPWESEDATHPGAGNVYILPWTVLDRFPQPPVHPHDSLQHALQSQESLRQYALRSTDSPVVTIDERFATALTPLEALNRTFLAVAAPGPLSYGSPSHSRITLFTRSLTSTPLKFLTLTLPSAPLGAVGQRWGGESLLAADLDGSGEEMLVIASPHSDAGRATAAGRVLVVRLTGTAEKPGQEEWELAIPAEAGAAGAYANFGRALAVAPKSRTLWISAPGLGSVFGYSFNASMQSFSHTATIALPSERRTGFGSALAVGVMDREEFVAVSAPNEEVDGVAQVGTVRVYLTGNDTHPPRLVSTIVPEENVKFTKFGGALAVAARSEGRGHGREVALVVGSEWAQEERGGVWIAPLNATSTSSTSTSPNSHNSDIDTNGAEPETEERQEVPIRFVGNEVNAHFGATLQVRDVFGCGGLDLVVGIPGAGATHVSMEKRFYGAVGVLRGVCSGDGEREREKKDKEREREDKKREKEREKKDKKREREREGRREEGEL